VETAIGIFECKARGLFRNKKITPLAGDRVTVSINENQENTIDSIEERKNELIRPPIANVDIMAIVVSTVNPKPSTLIIDRLTSIAVHKNIEPVIVITKSDLASPDELIDIYTKSGMRCIAVCSKTLEGVQAVKDLLKDKISVFTGNSAVGKSTLLNLIDPSLSLRTGEYSRKLGRGRHTTRHVELHKIGEGYIADTPGFSSLDFEKNDVILKDELCLCFPEFSDYIGECKFTSCSHTCEKGCKIVEAVKEGKISPSRHKSYVAFYNEAKNIKEWEL